MAVSLHGTGVAKGIAIGRARLLQRGRPEIPQYVLPARLLEEEVDRFPSALHTARVELRAVRNSIPPETPEEIAVSIVAELIAERRQASGSLNHKTVQVASKAASTAVSD